MEKYGKWSEQENTKFRTSGDNKELTLAPPSSLTGASLTLTLPDVSGTTDTMVSRTSTDTLTNKTLTSPVISTISNTGTLTLPTSTDTLVGRDTTDTLTNKTIDGDNNTVQDLALSTLKTTGNTNVFLQRDGSGNVIDSTKSVPSGDMVGTSDTQTLTGKTIDGDDNTIQDLALTSLKTTANTNVFLQRNGSGVVIDSTKAIPSGDVVGTSDSQTLTAKTLSDFLFDDASVSISTNSISVNSATVMRITSGTGPLNTMTGGSDGDVKLIVNELGSQLTIDDNNGADGFVSGSGADMVLEDDASIWVVYNGTTNRWQVVGQSPTDYAITTEGDVLLGDSTGKAVRLGIGAVGTVLTSNGTTASWQSPAGTGDVTAASNIADNALVRGDGGAKGIQQSGITIDDSDNVTGIGSLTATTLTDGTASLTAGAWTGITTLTASGTVQGGTLSDGTASITSGALSGVTTITSSGDLNVNSGNLFVDVSASRVGVGTSSPDRLLHVEGTDPYFRITNDDSALVSDQIIGGIEFEKLDASGSGAGVTGSISARAGDATGGISYLSFRTDDGTTADEEKARIGAEGTSTFWRNDTTTNGVLFVKKKDTDTTETNFIDFRVNAATLAAGGTFVGSIRLDSGSNLVIDNTSDQRLKTNITDYTEGYNIIKSVRAAKFDWVDDSRPDNVVGFIAQEVQAYYPSAVSTNHDHGYLGLAQTSLIPVLWSAVKVLIQKVEDLENAVV